MIAGSRPSSNGGISRAPPPSRLHCRVSSFGRVDPGRRSSTSSRRGQGVVHGFGPGGCRVRPADGSGHQLHGDDDAGTWGWVLGFTADGTWSVAVPATNGP